MNPFQDTRELERRMRDHLSAEQRFLLTRLALCWVRAENRQDPPRVCEGFLDRLMDEAERLGFGDLGSQIMDWAHNQTRLERK